MLGFDIFFGTLGAFLIVFLIIAIAVYLINSFAIKKALEYFSHPNTWMAFIPVLCNIALAQCMNSDEDENVSIFGKPIKKNYFVLFPLLQLVIWFIPILGSILSFAIGIIGCGIVYTELLSRSNDKGDQTVLAWVSAVIPLVWMVLCFTKFKGIENNINTVSSN